ncbi:RAN GTPase-activating protein 1 [Diplonema papillatum]|nr:RAN GTPase-activating protein 1 [Diplonema papillatum]|eukprot:gene473-697_t
MGKKKDKVPQPGKFPKTKKVEKECKGKWATWLKTKTTIDFLPGRMVEWDGAMVLAKALEKNGTVTNIDFSHNNVGDEGMTFLAGALKTNANIRILNVSCNNIGDGGGLALASALLTNRSLTDVNMLGNQLTCVSAQALGNVLKINWDLIRLNLSWNNIGHRGAKALAAAMEKHTLFTVDLGGQGGLGDDGCTYICDAWKEYGKDGVHNNLALWQNDIGKAGAQAVATLLQERALVIDLNLSWNSIGSEGLLRIGRALVASPPGKTTLKSVNVSHNIVGNTGAKEFAKVLEMSFPTLEKINLSNNEVSDEGADALAKALAKNTTLKHLDLSRNKIGDEGARAFGEAVRANKTLMTLQLQHNAFGDDSKTLLSDCMRGSETTTRDTRAPGPVPVRVNYGATDDENPYAEYIQKSATTSGNDDQRKSSR